MEEQNKPRHQAEIPKEDNARGRYPLSLKHWLLAVATTLALGALFVYMITRDSIVLSWVTGLVGTAFGTVIGSASQPGS